jgi:hypothetical protein
VTESESTRATIDEILSIIGLHTDFNDRARKHFEKLDKLELVQILTGSKNILNVARRYALPSEPRLAGSVNNEIAKTEESSSYARLIELKGMPSAQREEIGSTRYVTAVCDALREICRSGRLTDIVASHRNYVTIYHWVENLWADGELDARKEYWRILAITQRKVTNEHLPSLDKLWHRILLKSGSEYPRHYASVALQGFCWSNRTSTAEGMAGAVLTFLRWAESIHLAEGDFKQYCQTFLEILEQAFEELPATAPWEAFNISASEPNKGPRRYISWLTEVLQQNQRLLPAKRSAFVTRVPTTRDVRSFQEALETLPVPVGIARARNLFERYSELTWRFGDVPTMAIACNRIAASLLHLPAYAGNVEADRLIVQIALELVRWQPNHLSGWRLWLRGLTRNVQYPGVEFVLWEAIRRFPADRIFRNQLADFQKSQGRNLEAEHSLRSTIELFPMNIAAHEKLARLVASQPGRLNEAIAIGARASQLKGFSKKSFSKVLREIASRSETNVPLAEWDSRDTRSDNLNDRHPDYMVECVAMNGRALLAEFRLKCPALALEISAVRELQFLANEADLPFARFILARSLPNYVPIDSDAGAFPIAFVRALGRLDDSSWRSMVIMARSKESKWLVRVAESLLVRSGEDVDVAAWLSGEQIVPGRICSALRDRLTALIGRADSDKGAVVIQLVDAAAMMFDEEIAA